MAKGGKVVAHHRHAGQDWYYVYYVDSQPYIFDSGSSSPSLGRSFSLPQGGTWVKTAEKPEIVQEEPLEVVMEDGAPGATVITEEEAESETGQSEPSDDGNSGDSDGAGDGGDSGDGGGGDGGGGDGGGGDGGGGD